jgi:D-alanyl-D-alanine carboxypeptidase/Putative peptidoglycan binding domain
MTNWAETISFAEAGIDRHAVNGNLRGARNDTCNTLIGRPRGSYSSVCQDPIDSDFIALLETHDFGPFRATGIRPAIRVLQRIMVDIVAEKPEIHTVLRTAGMLCCRLVTGSSTSISNHSWGTAIDLKIGDALDTRGDNRVQRGLVEIWPIFNRHGFYWGAAFPTEDSMHFEASDSLIRDWASAGEFGTNRHAPRQAISFGDRSMAVQKLQQALNRVSPVVIEEDGNFGQDTRAALIAFQSRQGLLPTGMVTAALLAKLGLSGGGV